jgi:hypothetical protein
VTGNISKRTGGFDTSSGGGGGGGEYLYRVPKTA